MGYLDTSVYDDLEYPEQDDDCDCDSPCDCGPPGTIAIVGADGSTKQGWVFPSDAAQYYIDTIQPADGYMKLFHPFTQAYLGNVAADSYVALLQALIDQGDVGGSS